MSIATTDTGSAGETFTHGAWVHWAEVCIDQLQGVWNSLEQMAAQITADDGDQAQVAVIYDCMAQIEGVIAEGRQMVEQVNATAIPVGEAVAAAGGSENTPHKQYADEARSA
ncbi:MAG: hypothetical protein ABSF03_27150 [Streptosporangiaceae bacterium]|jgi:hypothetical protein